MTFSAEVISTCPGCGEVKPVQSGLVVLREAINHAPEEVKYCEHCWEAIDGADPITGAWGAAHVSVKRVNLN